MVALADLVLQAKAAQILVKPAQGALTVPLWSALFEEVANEMPPTISFMSRRVR